MGIAKRSAKIQYNSLIYKLFKVALFTNQFLNGNGVKIDAQWVTKLGPNLVYLQLH